MNENWVVLRTMKGISSSSFITAHGMKRWIAMKMKLHQATAPPCCPLAYTAKCSSQKRTQERM